MPIPLSEKYEFKYILVSKSGKNKYLAIENYMVTLLPCEVGSRGLVNTKKTSIEKS